MWVSGTLRPPRGSRVLKVHPVPLPLLPSQPLCSGKMRARDTRQTISWKDEARAGVGDVGCWGLRREDWCQVGTCEPKGLGSSWLHSFLLPETVVALPLQKWHKADLAPCYCKEIQPLYPKGNQSWIFFERTDAEAESPILWLPDAKNWLNGKDPDVGNDWRREEKGMAEDEMVGWHHWLEGHEFE